MSSAMMPSGQQMTKRMHQSKNFIMILYLFIYHNSIDVPKVENAVFEPLTALEPIFRIVIGQ
jgi:hypothetical protein